MICATARQGIVGFFINKQRENKIKKFKNLVRSLVSAVFSPLTAGLTAAVVVCVAGAMVTVEAAAETIPHTVINDDKIMKVAGEDDGIDRLLVTVFSPVTIEIDRIIITKKTLTISEQITNTVIMKETQLWTLTTVMQPITTTTTTTTIEENGDYGKYGLFGLFGLFGLAGSGGGGGSNNPNSLPSVGGGNGNNPDSQTGSLNELNRLISVLIASQDGRASVIINNDNRVNVTVINNNIVDNNDDILARINELIGILAARESAPITVIVNNVNNNAVTVIVNNVNNNVVTVVINNGNDNNGGNPGNPPPDDNNGGNPGNPPPDDDNGGNPDNPPPDDDNGGNPGNPPPMNTCPDGSMVPLDDDCPPGPTPTLLCFDGSLAVTFDECPTPPPVTAGTSGGAFATKNGVVQSFLDEPVVITLLFNKARTEFKRVKDGGVYLLHTGIPVNEKGGEFPTGNVVHRNVDDFTDKEYLIFGVWRERSFVNHDDIGGYAIGVPLPDDYSLPTSGTAIYRGEAIGFFNAFTREANVSFNANFSGDMTTMSGTLDGVIASGFQLLFSESTYNADSGKFIGGKVLCGNLNCAGNLTDNSWEGAFFSPAENGKPPTKFGGTFKAKGFTLLDCPCNRNGRAIGSFGAKLQ